jgi:hypothetical protein
LISVMFSNRRAPTCAMRARGWQDQPRIRPVDQIATSLVAVIPLHAVQVSAYARWAPTRLQRTGHEIAVKNSFEFPVNSPYIQTMSSADVASTSVPPSLGGLICSKRRLCGQAMLRWREAEAKGAAQKITDIPAYPVPLESVVSQRCFKSIP